MQARQYFTALTLAAAFFAGPVATFAQDPKPDNTKVNKRDRDKSEATADQQKENKSDRVLAKNIRRAIMDDKSLSTYAHNIKIIAQNGTVTLKGPVHTDEEKRAIEAKASEIAGAGNVHNEISVKGDHEADRDKK
ncbi:MAG: BON domain-containing protein [Acidobacteriota bacterium]|nr:BON domain-containing protein [Acidobacteriota bacterium]